MVEAAFYLYAAGVVVGMFFSGLSDDAPPLLVAILWPAALAIFIAMTPYLLGCYVRDRRSTHDHP